MSLYKCFLFKVTVASVGVTLTVSSDGAFQAVTGKNAVFIAPQLCCCVFLRSNSVLALTVSMLLLLGHA